MLLITSAAGNTGRAMVKNFVNAGFDVAATDISEKVRDLPGIKKAFVGDLTDQTFIDQIVSQVDQIVYIPPLFTSQEALIGKRLIDSASKNKLKQFIFISVTHPILTTLLQHVAKRDVEEYLIYRGMETQLPYTILQPMHYMHNFNPKLVADTLEYRIFYNVDTKLAYVDSDDVAEVAIKVAQNISKHNKATYELVGTATYSPNDLVAHFNQFTGKKAKAVYVDVTDFLDQIGASDLYFREAFQQLAASYSKWGLDGNPNVLTYLLERTPTSFEEYLEKNLV